MVDFMRRLFCAEPSGNEFPVLWQKNEDVTHTAYILVLWNFCFQKNVKIEIINNFPVMVLQFFFDTYKVKFE